MHDKPRYPFLRVDWLVVILYLSLLAFGWFSICGATHEIGDTDFFSFATRTGKQLVWIGLALVLGFVLLMMDDRYFETLADLLYWGMMLLLLVTPSPSKASRWWTCILPSMRLWSPRSK